MIEIEGQGALLRRTDGVISAFNGAPDEVDCYWRIAEPVFTDLVAGRRSGFDIFMRGEGFPQGNIAVLRQFDLLWHGPEREAALTELKDYRAPGTEKAEQEVFFVKCDDKIDIRCALWTPRKKVRGSILFLNGRREFIEKYYEVYENLIDRGFAVATLDWRGQGLSTREADHPHKGFVHDFDDFQKDLTLIWKDHLKPRLQGPIFILGHSMGGHNAIRFAHAHQAEISGLIAASPMVRIKASEVVTLLMKGLAWVNHQMNKDEAWLPAQGPLDIDDELFEDNGLSHDKQRWTWSQNLVRANSGLALGGVTSGWLRAALKSMALIHKKEFTSSLKTPVLVLGGTEDTTVDSGAAFAWADSCPNGRSVSVPMARHEIMRETDEIQVPFWKEVDQFLEENLR